MRPIFGAERVIGLLGGQQLVFVQPLLDSSKVLAACLFVLSVITTLILTL
ncbi:hypothetical protein ALTERO38_51499 [Alteromonas sp. 38]|nr:hypothetical protein ALTER154_80042 [Alteromonas sp. 154]VXB75992.1 hypothetical protein ALTERO38_51499 [Alteromonas sp. 38]